MVYLDNAATTAPKPESVIREVDRALRLYSANPGRGGHRTSIAAAQAVYRTRSLIRDFFHVPAVENVIFTSGCTCSLNTVIKGVLKKGDHAVISSFEHNAVWRPLYQMKALGLIDYSEAQVVPGDDEATLEAFRGAINERTRLIICTHASNVFGFRLPVERISALAHSYGIRFCLDAAQSASVLDIDMEKDGYDFVCCAGHKGLYGPTGTGLLLLNDAELPTPLIAGGTGSESASADMPDYYPDRLESGTLNIPGICGLGAGVRFVQTHSVKAIAEHEMTLIRYLYDELSEMPGVILYHTKPDLSSCAPVISFNLRGIDSETVSGSLDRRFQIAVRAGLHCAPLAHRAMGTFDEGTVRIAPSIFTTKRDIRYLVNALKIFGDNP